MAKAKRSKPRMPVFGADVEEAEIDNPEFGSYGEPEKITAHVNFKTDPLGRLYKHHKITRAQLQAGRKYGELCHSAEISGLKAVDYEPRIPSGARIGVQDRAIEAAGDLAQANTRIGRVAASLLNQVCFGGSTVAEYARRKSKERQKSYELMRYHHQESLIEALDTLANYWGIQKTV